MGDSANGTSERAYARKAQYGWGESKSGGRREECADDFVQAGIGFVDLTVYEKKANTRQGPVIQTVGPWRKLT